MKRTRHKNGGNSSWTTGSIPALLLGSVLLIVTGCASPRGDGPADTEELLGQDVTEGRVVEGTISPPGEPAESRERTRSGYRVQLLASTVREEADGVADVVKGLFPVEVYIDGSGRYYRVRAGDFQTRDEAEEFQRRLVEHGFESTWIVETQISTE